MRYPAFLLTLLLVLAGCLPVQTPGPRYTTSEIQLLLEDAAERWVYFYGDPQTIQHQGAVLELTDERLDHIWAVPGALAVNGAPLLREVLPGVRLPARTVQAIPSGRFVVSTETEVRSVWYYDGRWYKLARALDADRIAVRVPDREEPEFAALTREETRVILRELVQRAGGQAFVVYELEEPVFKRLRFSPSPRRHREAALAVQFGIERELILVEPRPELWRLLEQGTQSGYSLRDPQGFLALSPTHFAEVWDLIVQNRVPRPAPPRVDLGRHSVVAFFWGLKPTGGYRVDVREVRLAGRTLTVVLELTSPPPGAIVTQALTSPYILIQVNARPDRVVFVDDQGRLLAEAFGE